MLDLIEVFERADQGPLIKDMDYFMKHFVPKIQEVIKRHGVKWDKQTIVNTDNDLIDHVFEAAVDLIAEAGAYCPDTNRIMQFSKDEVMRAVEQAPKTASFGEGREHKAMTGRRLDDTETRPWIHVGGGIYTTDEQIYIDIVQGMAEIDIVDSVSVPSILHMRGKDARVRSPQEILSAIKTVILAKEAIRRSGRAGLPIINGISAASNSVSMIAAASPHFSLKTSDGYLVDFLAEMIVNYEALQKVAYFNSISANVGSTSTPLFGGYSGGAEGNAVLATAYIIMGVLIYRGNYHYNAPLHQTLRMSSTKPLLWSIGMSNQVNAKYMQRPMVNLPYLGGGAGTEMFHYEMAAYMLSVVPAGGQIFSGHPAKAVDPDSLLPYDHRFHAEMGLAAYKMTRKEAEPLAQTFFAKYEDKIKDPTPGYNFSQVYDLKTKKISNTDYLKTQDKVREEMKKQGLDVPRS
jgi:methylamine--corrinoid protein Co-methyltransferase